MKKYILKFESSSDANNYAIEDIPFTTSVATEPIQNLVCNRKGKKLVNVSGTVQIQNAIPDMIDLGLSVRWASFNVGASSIGEYGAYYAWAETDEKSDYSWGTYKYANGASNKLTKYCPSNKTNYWDGEGSPDNKIILDTTDDIASQTYGSSYRMPTKAELEELIALRNKWTIVNGIKGRVFVSASQSGVSDGDFSIVDGDNTDLYFYDESEEVEIVVSDYLSGDSLKYITSINELNAILTDTFAYQEDYEGQVDAATMLFKDNEHTIPAVAGTDYTFGSFPAFDSSSMLFIPAAGSFDGSTHGSAGSYCNLWSSSLNSDNPSNASRLNFNSGNISVNGSDRCLGFSVRCVSMD